MKYGALAAIVLALTLLGSTCVPLINLDNNSPSTPTGTLLSAAVTRPAVTREVAADSTIEIEWTAVNLTEDNAIAEVFVRWRTDLSETILAGGLRLPEAGGTQTLDWDTSGFQGGEYSIHVRVTAGGRSEESAAPGRITLNTAPSFEFTAPEMDVELGDPNAVIEPNTPSGPSVGGSDGDATTITIKWTAFDPDGDGMARLEVDPDEDDPNHDSGNEIIITELPLLEESSSESFDWDGSDESGVRVETDTYVLYARVTDDFNKDQLIENAGKLIIPDPPEEEPTPPLITAPDADTDFLESDADLKIEYLLGESEDVLVDLEIDPDDNNSNGNEIRIDSQRLVEVVEDEDTQTGEFDWNGDDEHNDPVPSGIYHVLLLINRGSGSPQIVSSDALVFRRVDDDQPLIALIEPNTDQTVEAGQFVFIKWRDDDHGGVEEPEDPNDPNTAAYDKDPAVIHLWLDDDDTFGDDPNDPAPMVEITPDPNDPIDALKDGVLDTFNYRVPELSVLGPGRYYIFATITREAVTPPDEGNVSRAAGQVVIDDPNSTN
jgi:flagellar hook assembly protein FlgD